MADYDKKALTLQEGGMSVADIADTLGITVGKVKHALLRAKRDPLTQKAMDATGARQEPHSYWAKVDGFSVYFKNEKEEFDPVGALEDYKPLDPKLFAPRINTGAKGGNLLVVDLADVHFGKLCVTSETNHEYNIEAARHRVIEGTRGLLRQSSGIGRILFVLGNDILHTENGKSTTSGTPQDTDGTYFTAWRAAQQATIDAISECAAVADVDLIHCMSNHDWRSGWALSQTIAAAMRGHSGVRATEYNMSERHRKYYGFERNGLMLTHGDGTKEEKLYGHFASEARDLISQWDHLYVYLHHMHHKITKRRGVDVFQSEKDHNGITAIVSGAPRPEGKHVGIEYVRSPSPPDGWHDRNGYVNRQAVEAFVHHPYDGQKARFTEWF